MYIAEAHAEDLWPMAYSFQWPSPKTLQERCGYARTMATEQAIEPSFRVLVDGMENSFNAALAPWPQGVYVVLAGTLLYRSQDSEGDTARYDINDLFTFLDQL